MKMLYRIEIWSEEKKSWLLNTMYLSRERAFRSMNAIREAGCPRTHLRLVATFGNTQRTEGGES